jgi:hypothetical protein
MEDDIGTPLRDLYAAFIDRVTVEIMDNEGRRIGIVGGEIQDGGCRQAVPIYPRDFITPDNPYVSWERKEGNVIKGIEQLVDYGRICARPQDGGYVIGVFNCMKFASCPTRLLQRRCGEWDDFFLREVVISAKDYWSDMDGDIEYSTSTPALPLPSMIRRPLTPFRDRDYCTFYGRGPQQIFERARNIIFQEGPVGPYRWTLAGESNTRWNEMVEDCDSETVLAVVRLYARRHSAPFGCRREVTREFISMFDSGGWSCDLSS